MDILMELAVLDVFLNAAVERLEQPSKRDTRSLGHLIDMAFDFPHSSARAERFTNAKDFVSLAGPSDHAIRIVSDAIASAVLKCKEYIKPVIFMQH
jgi:hypothetical protein